tara:strand:+ start:711 stop:1355 length:645 start_codon:yes stop_codon:yes gene_type:complete
MKKLILSLLLAPLLLFSQGPSFNVTDGNGNTWDSQFWLDNGVTIVITFFSPSMTCWPSANHITKLEEAHGLYGECNDILFIQIAQWGNEYQTTNFIEEFGNPSIPYVIGYYEGQTVTIDFIEWGLLYAYETWLLRPDGSYEANIPFVWDMDQQTLIDTLDEEGFYSCDHNSVDIEEHQLENNDKTIYDLQGRILNGIPKSGFYIQGGKKYCVIK